MTVLAFAACGGDDDGIDDVGGGAATAETTGTVPAEASTGDAGDPTGNAGVVNAPPPGQAIVFVDGLELLFDEPGGVGCIIEDDSFSFSFRIGDNEVTLGAGVIRAADAWMGAIDLVVANPDGEDGPIAYFPNLTDNSDRVSVDGNSMSFVGPFMKQPPQDGSNPTPVDVGEGTISVTCE